ncbi:MAG: response regulator, partial [bacterium]|nr:response regulator [bacterium]
RTPMNAILGFTTILEKEITDKKQKQFLEAVSSSGKTLMGLINDILDLSKIEAGKMELQHSPENLATVFEEIKQIFSLKALEKDLDFRLETDPRLPRALLLDGLRIRQVLINIVGNAFKFTETGFIKLSAHLQNSAPRSSTDNDLDTETDVDTEVDVDTETDMNTEADVDTETDMNTEADEDTETHAGNKAACVDITIAIEDSGIGIPLSQQQSIFEAFEQQRGQPAVKYGGTGLGLAITQRLVEMMGGTISVKSEEGKGSTFSVAIKDVAVSADSIEKDREEEIDMDSIRFEKALVLVADDKELNRRLLVQYFDVPGLDVLEAQNGREAVQLAKEYRPDLVLLDFKMPLLDGVEATRIFKSTHSLEAIPLIVITASTFGEQVEQLKNAGVDGYLSKPITKQDLFRQIMQFLPHTKIAGQKKREPQEKPDIPTGGTAGVDADGSLPRVMGLPPRVTGLRQLMVILEGDFNERRRKIQRTHIVSDIEAFAREAQQLGRQYHSTLLVNWAKKLMKNQNNFEMEEVARTLEVYPGLIEQIKKEAARQRENL